MKKLIAWVEIPATDFKRAVDFYSQVFSIKLETYEGEKEQMAFLPNGEGAISKAPNFEPSKNGVLVSLNTAKDLEVILQKIESLGGHTVTPKTKIEAEGRGYFAVFTDCEGNNIGLYQD